MKKLFISMLVVANIACAQYQEATITRTTSTNSVFPRQFPSMTIRKMNENEYWLFDSLSTNTIFHRQFPSFIVRRDTYGQGHSDQKWGVYRTTSTNSVFPRQFPDRYISDLNLQPQDKETPVIKSYHNESTTSTYKYSSSVEDTKSSYTYSKTLKSDSKPSYCPENPE